MKINTPNPKTFLWNSDAVTTSVHSLDKLVFLPAKQRKKKGGEVGLCNQILLKLFFNIIYKKMYTIFRYV